MFRSQYDSDITTFGPTGRIHQIEYAMEAVKQGSACVGAKSDSTAVVACLMRSENELASYQLKVFKVDEHMGVAISGITADGRLLTKYMRSECLNHRFTYESGMQTNRLVTKIADKQTGSHLFETSPSGNFYDYKAMAIGARSQSALDEKDLIKQALLALRETTQSSSDGLTNKNTAVGVVGKDRKFEILTGASLQPYLDSIDTKMEE